MMIIIHGYRATTLILYILLNVLVRIKYPAVVTAKIVDINENSLDFPPVTFGTINATSVLAQSGSTAMMPCVVHNLRERMTVLWIKWDEGDLLTEQWSTWIEDMRFKVVRNYDDEWTLRIKEVRPTDAGTYECQVSIYPSTSIFLSLEVVEAKAEIAGPAEKFVRSGSTLLLHCLVKKSTEVPLYLFWYHNFRMINYDVDRGVNVSTDLANRESWLEVPRASDRHSGNYTCNASNAVPAHVLVHIYKGDNPAAMQHSMTSSPSMMACTVLLTMFVTLKLALQTN